MTDPRLLDLLKNPDAAKRKAAIQALARSKDLEAIPYLERVADYDEDTSIRDIAEKAIVYINRNNPDNLGAPQQDPKRSPVSSPVDSPSPSLSGSNYADDAPMISGPVMVSPAEEERSRRLLSSALDLNMRDQNAKAVKAVVEAFRANPNLKDDAYARGVASTATGLNVSEAVTKVLDGSALDLFDPKKKAAKPKRDSGGGMGGGDLPTRDSDGREAGDETEVTFGGAMLDLLIYGLVNAVIVGGAVFVVLYLLLSSLPPSVLNEPIAPGTPFTLGEVINTFSAVGVPLLLFYSALYAVIQMLSMFFQSLVIHWAATSFMSGEGSFADLLHRLSVFYTMIVPLALVLPFIGGFLVGLVSTDSVDAFQNGQNIGNAISLGLSIYAIWGTSVRIGKTYHFSTGNGCLSLILGTAALFALCCVATIGLSYAVGNGATGL